MRGLVALSVLVVAAGIALQQHLPVTRPSTRPSTRPTTRPVGDLPPAEAARVRLLIRQLADPDPDVRQWAVDALRDVGKKGAPYLIEGLANPKADVRVGCAKVLGRIAAPEALQRLTVHLLRDPSVHVRAEAANALGALGRVGATPALAKALNDRDETVRSGAALAIGQTVRIARSRRPLTVEEQTTARVAVGPLIDALRDRKPAIRANAAMSLGVLRDPRALAPLALATLDQVPMVRASVCYGLADLGDKAAGGALIELLDDADVTVRRSAIEALERITRNTLGFRARAPAADRRRAIARWRIWWNRTKRQLQATNP